MQGAAKGISSLVSFRLAVAAFEKPMWQHLSEAGWRQSELEVLRSRVLCSLGAGFYAYSKAKVHHYNEARAATGAIIALCRSDPNLSEAWGADLYRLESELIPAITALVKKMEKSK